MTLNRRVYFDSVNDITSYIQKNGISMIDLKFVDLFGQLRHVTLSASSLQDSIFTDGVGFDGSSVTSFRDTECGDLNVIPDLDMAIIDPFFELPTLSFFCKIVEADNPSVQFPHDSRYIAWKAETYLRQKGLGDRILIGPEAEFYLFNSVSFNNAPTMSQFSVESDEMLRDNPTACCGFESCNHKFTGKNAYHLVPPFDRYHDIRSEITEIAEQCGIKIKYHHHEVGTLAQQEVELKFNTLLQGCDHLTLLKYIIRNIAHKHGLVATLMPKPLFAEPGNGLHVHMYIVDKDFNSLFFDEQGEYAQFSKMGISFISGVLDHGRSLSALTNPSTNSYKRLVPGYEAPTQLFFSMGNRSAAIRIPKYARTIADKRFEYRPPDATCNIYLAVSAIVMAGIDGVEQGLNPTFMINRTDKAPQFIGPVVDRVQDEPPVHLQALKSVPANLDEALCALEADYAYLTKPITLEDTAACGREEPVIKPELIHRWIQIIREQHVKPMSLRPTPYEYQLYFNC